MQDAFGHDACGVGFIARPDGQPSRPVVVLGLAALRRLAHRGAPAALGSVDGCGVLTAIPWRLFESTTAALPSGRTRAIAMAFIDPRDEARAVALIERELRRCGAIDVAWRRVPTDAAAVLPAQRATTPIVRQAFAAFDAGRVRAEWLAYRSRLSIERAAAADGVSLHVASLSTRTIVYKGLLTPDALERFYPDLARPAFTSPFITFHQRYSTNTSADWALAQPFRTLAHNGEINTIAGNRGWMRARLTDETSLPGFDESDPMSFTGSDSRTLDDAIELLRHHGYSLAHAVSRLVPPAWERDRDLPPDVRAFYEFQALVAEPWDGPSALVFADGRYVGAALDRNGFRPARWVTTADGFVALASEVGILPASEHEIVDRRRLGPGDLLLVDLERHRVWDTEQIRRRLAFRRRYRDLVARATHVRLQPDLSRLQSVLSDPHHPEVGGVAPPPDLTRRQAAFGCTREEIELILKPMIADAYEAVGSMGDDTPPAVLSSRPRLLTDYFRQRFAQVTNPPVDPYRESSVMSLETRIGGHGSFLDELAPRPARLVLRSPVLTREAVAQLADAEALSPALVDVTFDPSSGTAGFDARLAAIAVAACDAVRAGSALLILTDRGVDATRAPMPAVLALASVHQALVAAGLRMRASLVVHTGDARDAHQLAALFAYGAAAVCPSLGLETVESMAVADPTGCGVPAARYRLALERGLQTIMSKMGVCTFSSYCGSQLFEVVGLAPSVIARFFPGTASPLGGAALEDLAAAVIDRHRLAFSLDRPVLAYPGLHGFRRDGEYHTTNPVVVKSLQRARDEAPRVPAAGEHAYDTFTTHVYRRPPAAVRDLVEFVPQPPVDVEQVESADDICRRFFASAMSVGALSPEAHRLIAVAMNRIGARSNSGEGGEEPDRFRRPVTGDWAGSRTKQVASARFGVTPAYLRSADELQIKIAQGSKPGEGGQLPASKVVPHIARLRHVQPGTPLISPPVHHDIYSIEDLAQLIFDLRTFNPAARINVKLVASSGIGVIATGVAKAGADAIQISGHDGGTGASPRASIKHAGMPWEVGLVEAHRALERAGLRDRILLQTDGGLKTGRDIAIAAALGADEYGFGTAALVAIGCVMARQCHLNTCPVGIATQRDDLRLEFSATPEMLIGYLRLIAGEVREILGSLGLRTIGELVGRRDLLRQRADVTTALDLRSLLDRERQPRKAPKTQYTPSAAVSAGAAMAFTLPLSRSGTIANTDRAFGADIAGIIAAQCGDAGLADGSVQLSMTGSAGQSFGAFALPGMRLTLVGDANDGLGKGMHGGDIIVAPSARERGRARQVLVGNAALYGATGGRVFVAGHVGERFAVRNSGATAVIEGAGDHACEYMTGGTVVILGPVGRNVAAGMTGGVAFIADRQRTLAARIGGDTMTVLPLTASELRTVRDLIETHERLTGSRVARSILRNDPALSTFVAVRSAEAIARRQATVDSSESTVDGADGLAVNE